LFGVNPSGVESVNLTILYRTVTKNGSELLSGLSGPFLHIGNIGSVPDGDWRFCFSKEGFDRCSESEFSGVRSLITSLPGNGSYRILAEDGTNSGFLWPSDKERFFNVQERQSFFENASFVGPETRSQSHTSTRTFTIHLSDHLRPRRWDIIHISIFFIVVPTEL
jgi:hypothetical protein